ncbi:hypothetical protein HJ075_20620 [Vibrio parahaemolyticus]|nr:hypothetical protein [Vibrio parahaemolyticus]
MASHTSMAVLVQVRGVKKEEATKQIRVPVSLVDSLTTLKNMYKGLDTQSKADLIEQINDLIVSKS